MKKETRNLIIKANENAIEMEKCFLGCLLQSNITETRLKKDDFFSIPHQKIFTAITSLWKQEVKADISTVGNELKKQNAGVPASTVSSLTNNVLPSNIKYYENEVFTASKKRCLIKTLLHAADLAAAENYDTDTVIKDLISNLAEESVARNEAQIKTAKELLTSDFHETKWIVKDLIGGGLSLLCGAPKIGKSWLILNLAIAAAAGGKFLGTLDAEKTETLYLALEDTDRRIHNRLKTLNAAHYENLKITTQWKDGYTGLENYLLANKGIGLVIIDTLAKFANIKDMNEYAGTTEAMARIKKIADAENIAIIVTHHAKKTSGNNQTIDWTELALGSTGLTGAADSTILIQRERNTNTAKIYATGRDAADFQKEIVFSLDKDAALTGWSVKDKTSEQGEAKRTGENETKETEDNFNWGKV